MLSVIILSNIIVSVIMPNVVMLRVIILNVIIVICVVMLSFLILSVNMLSVLVLSAIMPNVMAPFLLVTILFQLNKENLVTEGSCQACIQPQWIQLNLEMKNFCHYFVVLFKKSLNFDKISKPHRIVLNQNQNCENLFNVNL